MARLIPFGIAGGSTAPREAKRSAKHMKVGDRIIVTNPLSSFYQMTGVVEEINVMNGDRFWTPFWCFCSIVGYLSPDQSPTPFMESELQLTESPSLATPEEPIVRD